MNSLDTLNAFIASNPDPRELKRALAIKIALIPVRIAKFKRSWALRHASSPSGSIAFIEQGPMVYGWRTKAPNPIWLPINDSRC